MATIGRELGKRIGGRLLTWGGGAKYTYRNCIFILAHMRCGSTALSNIICSRPDVSGYGEAHVAYDGPGAIGRLAMNQMRRRGWTGNARFLFDKILHSRHDGAAPDGFFKARAIFVIREPEPAIRSICKLFTDLDRDEYRTHREAALYYSQRLATLTRLWDRFPAERRIGLTHMGLLQDPDMALHAISTQLRFDPPLENSYRSPEASRRGGGGDPMVSARHARIEPALLRPSRALEELDLSPGLARDCEERFEAMRARIATGWPGLAV